jgi:hypothetical protein
LYRTVLGQAADDLLRPDSLSAASNQPKMLLLTPTSRLAVSAWPLRIRVLLLCLALGGGAHVLTAQQAKPQQQPTGSPADWLTSAAGNEVRLIAEDGTLPLRYVLRKKDAKGDTTREVIDTPDGSVARLIARNGQPLTPQEEADERGRLRLLLTDPEDFAAHRKRSESARSYSRQIVQSFPSAMIATYAPGQPQLEGVHDAQVVLDFQPNPDFHPPSLIAEALTGIHGRLWIDEQTRNVVRIDGTFLHAVDIGWGLVARIQPGGQFRFQQAPLPDGHWVYSGLMSRLTVRELMVHTTQANTDLAYSGFHILPQPVTWQQAIHLLLAEK